MHSRIATPRAGQACEGWENEYTYEAGPMDQHLIGGHAGEGACADHSVSATAPGTTLVHQQALLRIDAAHVSKECSLRVSIGTRQTAASGTRHTTTHTETEPRVEPVHMPHAVHTRREGRFLSLPTEARRKTVKYRPCLTVPSVQPYHAVQCSK